MESLKNKVAIVGLGYTPQGRIPDRSPISFYLEAAKNAVEDAGLKMKDVDGLLIQPRANAPGTTVYGIAQQLGMRPRFMYEQNTWGATGTMCAHHAIFALEHGLANYVVCAYGEAPIRVGRAAGFSYGGGQRVGDNAAFGYFGGNAGYGMGARRGMHVFGTGPVDRYITHICIQ